MTLTAIGGSVLLCIGGLGERKGQEEWMEERKERREKGKDEGDMDKGRDEETGEGKKRKIWEWEGSEEKGLREGRRRQRK